MVREGKPKGFFYLDHRTTCGQHNLITDTHITAANVHDSIPYLERLDRQRERFNFETEAVGLDAGYMNAPLCKGLEDRKLYGVIGYRRPTHIKGRLPKRAYVYDADQDIYHCPEGQQLSYRTTNRDGYREYRSDPELCRNCPWLGQCTSNAQQVKTVTRHVWEEERDKIDVHRLTREGKALYKRRKETIERSFADVSFLAAMLVDKFCYHLPLYRQHQRLSEAGITVSRHWLTQLTHRTAGLLAPIAAAQLEHIRAGRVIAIDETPIKAGRKAKGKMKTGYFWPVYGEADEVSFVYRPSRAERHVHEILTPPRRA